MASCPGWFILLPAKDLCQTLSSVNSYCTIILEYLVVTDVNFISAKLRCLHPTFSLVTLVRGVGGGGKLFSLVTHPRSWGRAVQAGLSSPPPPAKDLGQTVSSINSYYLRLTQIKFISISTKYSCSRWCIKICGLSILSEILGGGQDKLPWTACHPPPHPHPLSIRNQTEHFK